METRTPATALWVVVPVRLQPWLVVIAGVLAVGAFAPFAYYPLAFLALAILFYAIPPINVSRELAGVAALYALHRLLRRGKEHERW